MMKFPKSTEAVIFFTLDLSKWLLENELIDQIVSVTPTAGLNVDSSNKVNNDTGLFSKLSGGENDGFYGVKYIWSTTLGRVDSRIAYFKVKDRTL